MIPIDRVVLQADYGMSLNLEIECSRAQGGEPVMEAVQVHMKGEVGRWL